MGKNKLKYKIKEIVNKKSNFEKIMKRRDLLRWYTEHLEQYNVKKNYRKFWKDLELN